MQDCALLAFLKWYSSRLTSNSMLQRFSILVACTISFSSAVYAACLGSSHQTSLAGYALSPDATRIAALADDGTLFWWDVATGRRTELMACVQADLIDHPILFSPDSSQLAVVIDNVVQVFHISGGEAPAKMFSEKMTGVRGLVFSADGGRLAAAHDEGVAVWEMKSQAEIFSIPDRTNRDALALNQDGSLLALWSLLPGVHQYLQHGPPSLRTVIPER